THGSCCSGLHEAAHRPLLRRPRVGCTEDPAAALDARASPTCQTSAPPSDSVDFFGTTLRPLSCGRDPGCTNKGRAARRPPGPMLVLRAGGDLGPVGVVLGPRLADLDGGAHEIRGEVVEPEGFKLPSRFLYAVPIRVQ